MLSFKKEAPSLAFGLVAQDQLCILYIKPRGDEGRDKLGLIKPIFPNAIFHLLNTSGVMNYKNSVA